MFILFWLWRDVSTVRGAVGSRAPFVTFQSWMFRDFSNNLESKRMFDEVNGIFPFRFFCFYLFIDLFSYWWKKCPSKRYLSIKGRTTKRSVSSSSTSMVVRRSVRVLWARKQNKRTFYYKVHYATHIFFPGRNVPYKKRDESNPYLLGVVCSKTYSSESDCRPTEETHFVVVKHRTFVTTSWPLQTPVLLTSTGETSVFGAEL